jgi:hypothetical protein
VTGNTTLSGTVAITGDQTNSANLSVEGNTTLGNASTDTLTFTSGSWSLPNTTTASVSSTLNFDSNTFVIDGINNRIGIGIAAPSTVSSVVGTSAAGAIASVVNNTTTASSAVQALRIGVGNNTGCTSAATCPRLINFYKNIGTGDSGGTAIGHTRISNAGTGITTTSGAADFAEYMVLDSASSDGDLVGFGGGVKRLAQSGDVLLGSVSNNSAFIGNGNLESTTNAAVVGLIGVVPAKVNTSGGSIAVGDPITVSSTAGVGMKQVSSGYTVGYALASYSGVGMGTIDIFVAPKYTDVAALVGGGGSGAAGYWSRAGSTVSLSNIADTLSIAGSTNLSGALNTSGTVSLSSLTASLPLKLNGSNQITSSAITSSDISATAGITNAQLANSAFTTALTSAGTDVAVSGSPTSLGGTLTLNIPDASPTARGVITTGSQTIAGDKSFNGNTAITGTNTFAVGTGAVTLGGTLAVTGATTLSSTLSSGAITTSGNFSQTGAATFSTGTGAVSFNGTTTVSGSNNLVVGGSVAVNGGYLTTAQSSAGLFNSTATTLNIGGAAATINIGAAGAILRGNGALTVASAVGTALSVDSGTTGALNIGAGANAKTITLGNTTVASTILANSGATTQNAFTVSAPSITTGKAFEVTGPVSSSLLHVRSVGASGNFGGIASSGAFVSMNSMFTEEFEVNKNTTAVTADNTTGLGDSTAFAYDTNSTNGTSYSTPTNSVGGYARFTLPAISGNGFRFLKGRSTTAYNGSYLKSNLPVMQAKVRPGSSAVTEDYRIGFMGSTVTAIGASGTLTNDASPADGIYFSNENGTAWTGVVRSGGVNVGTAVCSATISTTQFATLRIEVESATSVRFWADADASNGISLVDCGSVSGANPTSALTVGLQYTHTTTTTPTFDIDYIRTWQDDADPIPEAVLNNEILEPVIEIDPALLEPNTENQNLLEEKIGSWATDMRKYWYYADRVVSQAILQVKELISPKVTTEQLCLAGADGETICVTKDMVKQMFLQNSISVQPQPAPITTATDPQINTPPVNLDTDINTQPVTSDTETVSTDPQADQPPQISETPAPEQQAIPPVE